MNLKHFIFVLIATSLLSCSDKDDTITDPNQNLEFEYQLVWSDEFNGTTVNKNNWSFVIWDAGRVNNEWQKYVESSENYKIDNGKLHITATKIGENQSGGYASTRLISKSKQEFKYARIEFKANMPEGRGTWPALWMLGSNHDEVGWPDCGEIDILEYVGYQPNRVHNNIHTRDDFGVTNNGSNNLLNTAEEEFHVYGITWTNTKIEFYLDDPTNVVNTYSPSNITAENWPFAQEFYLIMNFAVGGDWGGIQGVDETIWPQTMIVDYVRVYQLRLV